MFIIFVEGPCPRKLNVFKISALRTPHSNIIDILTELRETGVYFPQSAMSTYSAIYSRLPRVTSIFRSIDPNSRLYFLTPLGLFGENDPAIWYEECFADLAPDKLRETLQRFGGLDKMYDLLEEEFSLAVFCFSARLLRIIEPEYYVPADRPAVIISDTYSSSRPNIYSITLNHFLISRLKKTYGKLTIGDIYQYSLEYIAKSLSIVREKVDDIKILLRNPRALFDEIFSPEVLNTILAPTKRQDKLVRFIR